MTLDNYTLTVISKLAYPVDLCQSLYTSSCFLNIFYRQVIALFSSNRESALRYFHHDNHGNHHSDLVDMQFPYFLY